MLLNKKLTTLLAGLVCYGLSATAAHAVKINEVFPDAGELLASAQDTTGTGASLSSIAGTLIQLGTRIDPVTGEEVPKDDIDLYKILITDPAAFAVTVAASLSVDNDAMLWLFDTTGTVVLFDDDISDPDNLLPQFNPGELAGSPAGMYFLALNLFETNPDNVKAVPPNLDSEWFRDPIPFQTGSYTLNLTGVETAPAAVPEPGMLALFGLGLAGMGIARRRMKA